MLPEHILAEVPRLCAMCHEFPVMQANPAHFCTVCVLDQRRKALSDRMVGILADRGQRPEEWRIAALDWGADAQCGGGV